MANTIIEKYVAAGQAAMIGSAGRADYLIIAQDPETGARLGFKIWGVGCNLEDGSEALILFSRVRLMRWDGAEVTNIDGTVLQPAPNAVEDWASAFPKFEFAKTNAERRSFEIGTLVKRLHKDLWMVPYDLEACAYYEQLMAWFKNRVPRPAWTMSLESFEQFLRDSVTDFLSGVPNAPVTKESLQAKKTSIHAQIKLLEAELDKTMAALNGDLPDVSKMITPLTTPVSEVLYLPALHQHLKETLIQGKKPTLTVHAGGLAEDDDDFD